jgi:hypothetical protein
MKRAPPEIPAGRTVSWPELHFDMINMIDMIDYDQAVLTHAFPS